MFQSRFFKISFGFLFLGLFVSFTTKNQAWSQVTQKNFNLKSQTTSQVQNKTKSDYIVAKINSTAITMLELEDRLNYVTYSAKISKNSFDRDLLLNQVLDKMIDEELIAQEAKKLKIESDENEMRNALEIIAKQQKKNVNQLKFSLINQGISFNNFLKQVESELLWSKILSEIVSRSIKVTEVEVNELFEQEKFNVSVQKFHLAELVISKDLTGTSAEKLAQKLVKELKNGANFSGMVRQFSSSSFTENGGEIGWVSKNDIDSKIYGEISKLKKGDYSEPVLLGDGFHIFKILDLKVETKIHENDLKAAKNLIFSRKLQTAAKGYLIDLRKKSFVEKSFR